MPVIQKNIPLKNQEVLQLYMKSVLNRFVLQLITIFQNTVL